MNKFEFRPTINNVGCFVKVDLKLINNSQIKIIQNLLDKFGVLFFKNQNLSPKEYLDFSSNFGAPAKYPMLKPHKDFKDIYVIERKKEDNGKSFGEGYHTDSQYLEKPPRYTLLQAINVPNEGQGNTLFANQFLAYEALPNKLKNKIEKIKGIFSSKGKIASTRVLREKEHGTSDVKEIRSTHSIVQTINGRKTIYCSPGHLIELLNCETDQKKLINFLLSHQTKPEFTFSFSWTPGDIALWSNRCMLHAATAFNGDRKMFRITIQ